MNFLHKIAIVSTMLISSTAFSAVSLNIRIGQVVNNKVIEISKSISSDYNKEIVIQDDAFKDKLVFTLKKFKNVVVNGNKIEPVQINLKSFNTHDNTSTKTQTVTSFYKNEASFTISTVEPVRNLDINLEFTEVN